MSQDLADLVPQLVVAAILAIIGYSIFGHFQRVRRARRIDAFHFPYFVTEKVCKKYPHLTREDIRQVEDGLREYFHLCNLANRRMVAMPSQVVDVAWHEFILFTRLYKQFCADHLGRFLHHTPAEAMQSPTVAQDGIKRAWRLSCHRSGIDPKSPSRLPVLFALDSSLAIPDGFHYAVDCTREQGYCAGSIGCGGGCGGDSGSDSGGDSGCGGGCGGD